VVPSLGYIKVGTKERQHFYVLVLNVFWQVHPRMKHALNYGETLKERFEEYPQIKRIAKHRHVPYRIFRQQIELKTIMKSQSRK